VVVLGVEADPFLGMVENGVVWCPCLVGCFKPLKFRGLQACLTLYYYLFFYCF